MISQEKADKVWENAEVSKRGDDRYYVSNPKGTFLWAEVIVLAGGGLLVHGDCETVLFGCHSKAPLSLMGGRPTDSYVLEKAQIGTGKSFLEFDIDSARKEIDALRPDLVESKVLSGLSPEEAALFVEDVIDEFLMNSEDGQYALGIRDLCDHFDGFDENFHGLGMVMDHHLFYAHAAVRKVWAWVRNELGMSSE